jgi:hypothetical protein
MEGIKSFPPNIQRLLQQKGYFNLTPQQRLEKHKDTLTKLKQIPHFNYKAGKKAIRELRGE